MSRSNQQRLPAEESLRIIRETVRQTGWITLARNAVATLFSTLKGTKHLEAENARLREEVTRLTAARGQRR